jgi:hypothetical protein
MLESLCAEINDAIVKETGLSIRMKWKGYKPEHIHLDGLKIIDISPPTPVVERSYEKVKEVFEVNHCKIINKATFIKKVKGANIYMKKEALKTSYENLKYDEIVSVGNDTKIITKSFISKWLEDETMRSYEDVGVYPPDIECPPNYYNLWVPFEMENITDYEYNDDAVTKFRNHIRILCNNDDSHFEYFEKWIAQMIQYPSVKTIFPTFISKQGAGKSTINVLFTKMFGSAKVFSTSVISNVVGTFNPMMADAFLVNLNELSKKDTMAMDSYMKESITDSTIVINIKGVSQFVIPSFHRFIGFTNSEDPLITTKDDRRNWIVKCSNELIGNKDYFKMIYDLIDDVNAVKSYYEYLKQIPDMDRFNKLPMPITEYQRDLQTTNDSPIETWLKHFVTMNFDKGSIRLTSKECFDKFNEWASSVNIDYKLNIVKFGVRLKHLNVNGVEKGPPTNKGETKVFDIEKMKQHFGIGCLLRLNDSEVEEEGF